MASPIMTLKTAPLQFAEFKPLIYQQQVADKNILRNSLNQIESRRREANTNNDAYEQRVAEIRDKLDPTEYANFDKEFSNISNRIGELIELGDSGEAIRVATTAGRDMANDPKWKNKMQVKAQRDKWLAEAKASGYDAITLRRMEKENPYKDNGDGEFKHLNYYKVYPLTDIAQVVINRTPTRQHSSGSSSTTGGDYFIDSKTGKVVNTPLNKDNTVNTNLAAMGYSKQFGSSSSISVQELTTKDLYANWQAIIKEPDYNASLRQQFDNEIWRYKEAYQIFNDPNSTEEQKNQAYNDMQIAKDSLQLESGFILSPHSFEEKDEAFHKWTDLRFKELFDRAAYKHVSTQSSTSNVTNWTGISGNKESGSVTGTSEYDTQLGLIPDATGQGIVIKIGDNVTPGSALTPSQEVKNVRARG